MNSLAGLVAAFTIPLFSLSCIAEPPEVAHFNSGNRQVAYDIYGINSSGPVIIVLHGASGPDAPLYRDFAQDLATKNNSVLFLHYFDASETRGGSPENYMRWQNAVRDLVLACKNDPRWSNRKIGLVGFSMGASVALSAGSQLVPVNAIAEWYGSLPDEFFYQLKGMPPLLILHGAQDSNIPVVNAKQLIQLCEIKRFRCENHIYSDQGHGFLPPAYNDAVKRTVDFFSHYLK